MVLTPARSDRPTDAALSLIVTMLLHFAWVASECSTSPNTTGVPGVNGQMLGELSSSVPSETGPIDEMFAFCIGVMCAPTRSRLPTAARTFSLTAFWPQAADCAALSCASQLTTWIG